MEQLDKYGFDHPTNTIVSGPSGSGKSQILAQILGCADYIFDPSPVKKILFYREDQTIYDQWYESGLITHKQKGMPGLKQAAILAYQHLKNTLELYGYTYILYKRGKHDIQVDT